MYFGLNLDSVISGEVSLHHAACLAACLPLGSATLAKIDERLSFTNTDWLLLGILNSFRDKPLDPFKEDEQKDIALMDIDALEEYLARPREDVSSSEF